MKNNRERLSRAMNSVVARAIKRGQAVDVDQMALSLSSKYPQSGIPIDLICQQIEAIVAQASELRPQDSDALLSPP